VDQALLLMMTRHLIEREPTADGFRYRAGENAAPFLRALESRYLHDLKARAAWLVQQFGDQGEDEFRLVMARFLDRWVEEFQAAERSLGSEG